MQKFPVGYFIRVVCSGVNGQEGLGWLSLRELPVWVSVPATHVGLMGEMGICKSCSWHTWLQEWLRQRKTHLVP